MTLALRYAVRSDVGLLREGNEDSAYAGPRLLAVADGMGGHAAGEVASAAAISALAGLDAELPSNQLLDALADAVARANRTLHDMVREDPSIGGMGTTLTAMLWSGARAALVHIGDSRAYVLAGGELHQITHDHTLVQSLVDEGRITADEAATHPQRSLLLRALDGTSEADPDLSLREVADGDRYLLCSDGLSSVVSEETLRRTLAEIADPGDAVLRLIELAIKGGGPDNITCIVADVIDPARQPATRTSVLAGAASNGAQGTRPEASRAASPAGRAHLLGQTAPQPAVVEHDELPPVAADEPAALTAKRRWPLVTSLLALLIGVLIGGGYLGYAVTQSQYYVGEAGGQVAIYQGVSQSVLGVNLSHVLQKTGVPVAGVPISDQQQLRSTLAASSLANARQIVATIKGVFTRCQNAQTALAAYNTKLASYRDALRTYEKTYHTDKPKRVNGKLKVPPKNTAGSKPTVPANCPPGPAVSASPSQP